MSERAPIRIGNASGFYGDRFSAVQEMLTDGPLDVLTGDYLAELTMLILGRDRLKDRSRGYAKTFLRQMRENVALARRHDVKIVANAGGLNPAGLAHELRALMSELDLDARIAYVEGDDLLPRAAELGLGQPLTANAYLGAWGIAECLRAGADVVVTGRVTDASLVVGPAAARFEWSYQDYDRLAGAVVAGHAIECGAQVTGGNYSFFTEHYIGKPGFPIAEVYADGSSVITKHRGTGGAVTADTVTAQLLYEIAGPRYAGPDVTTRFDTISLTEEQTDRVRITGVRGEAPPPTWKAGLNTVAGYRNEITFVLTGLDIEAKAVLVREQLEAALKPNPPNEVRWTLARTDQADADTEQRASALLHCAVKDTDDAVVGRAFSGAAVELALASYPGFHVTAPPAQAAPYGVYIAADVDAREVEHIAVLPDGARVDVAPAPETIDVAALEDPELPEPLQVGATCWAPLGRVVGARSGDKGGSANVGVWARSDGSWRWLAYFLTTEKFRELLPETENLSVTRHIFTQLRAVNFVVEGILGQGVAAAERFDPQAKALGEWLRARYVDIAEELL